MFNMSSALLKNMLKTQIKTLKKMKVEMVPEKTQSKRTYRIKDQDIKSQEACLVLEDMETEEIIHLSFKF